MYEFWGDTIHPTLVGIKIVFFFFFKDGNTGELRLGSWYLCAGYMREIEEAEFRIFFPYNLMQTMEL